MIQLLIGDCHFGVCSNSINWLENQLKYFNTQVKTILYNNPNIKQVVFLGDLFDIRYSTNQQIGIEVKALIRELADTNLNKDFIFVAGNHDYLSPLEEFHKYNSYDLVFGPEFSEMHKNVVFVTHVPYEDGSGNLFLPWYYTENHENFMEAMNMYKDKKINNIFCHTDLAKWGDSYTELFDNSVQVYSGHIHYPFERDNFHNIGAAFSFTFSDVNSSRYIYLIDDTGIIDKYENVTTPKFKQFKNEEIFDLTDKDFENSYMKLYIFSSNVNKAKYIERIKEIKNDYASYNVKIQIVDDSIGTNIELSYFNANIESYIDENIPVYLNDKYTTIKEKIKINKEQEQL